MKCLVTGSQGYLGKYLTKELSAKHEIKLFDIKYGQDILGDEIVENIYKSDIVFHLAALTSVEESFEHQTLYKTINVEGTRRVAYFCNLFNKKLIYPSSAAIYDAKSSPYGESKYLAERQIKAYCKSNSYVIMRIFNIYSLEPKIGSIMDKFLNNDSIIINGKGNQTRDFIRVEDVVSIMVDAIKSKYNDLLFDVGMGRAYEVKYIAKLFNKYRKVQLDFGKEVSEVYRSVADNNLLKHLYEGEYITNVEKDIKTMCEGRKIN